MPFRKSDSQHFISALRNKLCAVVALSLCACSVARAVQSVSLGWNPNGSGTAGYYLYSGSNSGNYTSKIDVGTNTSFTVTGLQEGQTRYFTVRAYNQAGVEGNPSAEIAFIVPGVLQLVKGENPDSPISLSMPVAPGRWYEVQASADMRSWTTIEQTQPATSNGWIQVVDPQSGTLSSRFYRLIMH
jgi:hypothetical protein